MVSSLEIYQLLGNISYPKSKNQLIIIARRNGMSKGLINTLVALPENDYHSPAELLESIEEEDDNGYTEA